MNTTQNPRLPGKVAVVAGAASGIGRATVELFAVNGHFGQLDVLVSNAGNCIGASFEDATDAIRERTFAVSVTSIRG